MNKPNKIYLFTIGFFLFFNSFGQNLKLKNNDAGLISLGGRTTISLFNDTQSNSSGSGLGGQFRIQFADRINSDWFFDYLTSDIENLANRTDYHIGWSVLVYPVPKMKIMKPYIIAGHCFDYSYLAENINPSNKIERWSSAVQGGLGTHFNLSPRLDCSLTGQYMIHLGNHIHSEISGNTVIFTSEKGASLEGHLLITLSLNYKLIDLW